MSGAGIIQPAVKRALLSVLIGVLATAALFAVPLFTYGGGIMFDGSRFEPVWADRRLWAVIALAAANASMSLYFFAYLRAKTDAKQRLSLWLLVPVVAWLAFCVVAIMSMGFESVG